MKKDFTIVRIIDGGIDNIKGIVNLFVGVPDGKYIVERSRYNKRSNQQNAYYWMILTDYIQPALYNEGWREIKDKEDAHAFVSNLFLKVKIVNEISGDTTERVKSTTELNKAQFNEYLEEIWQWAAEYLQITIPEPNQQLQFFDDETT